MQDCSRIDYDFYNDEEETISLSNLVTHDAAAWDDYSSRDLSPNSNLSSFEQNCFEFFTQEWSTESQRHHQNIIFCGKLIPSKSPTTFTKRNESEYSILSKNGSTVEKSSKRMSDTKTFGRNDISVDERKMLGLTSPTKSSWYMSFLGMAPKSRTSGGVALRDIKSRLSRRQISGGQQSDDCRKKSRGGGFGGLVKALACGEYNATAVTASIKRISRV